LKTQHKLFTLLGAIPLMFVALCIGSRSARADAIPPVLQSYETNDLASGTQYDGVTFDVSGSAEFYGPADVIGGTGVTSTNPDLTQDVLAMPSTDSPLLVLLPFDTAPQNGDGLMVTYAFATGGTQAFDFTFQNGSYVVSAVEPATFSMLLLGLVAVCGVYLKRRGNQPAAASSSR
jgi:hypothetical protein